jgi:hypothetical protein
MVGRLEPGDSGRNPGLDVERSLDAVIELHEATDWTDVPGATATERPPGPSDSSTLANTHGGRDEHPAR